MEVGVAVVEIEIVAADTYLDELDFLDQLLDKQDIKLALFKKHIVL